MAAADKKRDFFLFPGHVFLVTTTSLHDRLRLEIARTAEEVASITTWNADQMEAFKQWTFKHNDPGVILIDDKDDSMVLVIPERQLDIRRLRQSPPPPQVPAMTTVPVQLPASKPKG